MKFKKKLTTNSFFFFFLRLTKYDLRDDRIYKMPALYRLVGYLGDEACRLYGSNYESIESVRMAIPPWEKLDQMVRVQGAPVPTCVCQSDLALLPSGLCVLALADTTAYL